MSKATQRLHKLAKRELCLIKDYWDLVVFIVVLVVPIQQIADISERCEMSPLASHQTAGYVIQREGACAVSCKSKTILYFQTILISFNVIFIDAFNVINLLSNHIIF